MRDRRDQRQPRLPRHPARWADRRQPIVAHDIAAQVAQGESGIFGVMMESFIVDGRQDLRDRASLVYGQSITDACISWETTVPVLEELAQAVRSRRHR